MSARNARFAAIPNISPVGEAPDWLLNVLAAMKENVELLVGARGADNPACAIIKGQLTVVNPPSQAMTRVTAGGVGYTIDGMTVPSFEDYGKLVANVQQLANDVANLHSTLSMLISQLKR